MNDYIHVTIDICKTSQPAEIRADTTIEQLLDEILREFKNEIARDFGASRKEEFALWRLNGVQPLELTATLSQLRIIRDARLVFGLEEGRPAVRPFRLKDNWMDHENSKLLDHSGVKLYDPNHEKYLAWTHVPSIIGRLGSKGFERIQEIVIEASDYPDVIELVSRDHAAMIQRGEYFYIVPLQVDRTVLLNQEELEVNIAYPLEHNDEILFEESDIVLIFYRD
ncbi:MAG: hypothetical protein MUF87_04925 [Anaerolineae bacterium]|jgi:hypothetical protein|nr:hypothetical protein [Anaerolineae bacterium]